MTDTQFVDFAALVRPNKPNTYLLAPTGLCQEASPDGDAPFFDVAPAALIARANEAVRTMSGVRDIVVSADGTAMRYVAVTAIMRFKDDIDLLAVPAEGGAHLAIYSRSRVGYSDMGANKKRVDALVAALKAP